MNKNAKAWVRGLRSGKYKQGKGQLCDPTTKLYCCLGVACEIAIKHGVRVRKTVSGLYGRYDGVISYLPQSVRVWLGLKTPSGHYYGASLAQLNDSGTGFEEIADIIESEPKGLFERGRS